MPSNAMKISHLIQQLEGLRGFHGDLDVIFAHEGAIIAVDGRNVNVAGEVLGQTLAQPALVIGLWRDEQGRLRNSPGAAYVATAYDGLWNYRRETMPESEDVRVWKRYGGEDIGKRVGEKYYVREGMDEWGKRPVEIIPAGILGWRPL